MRIYIHIPFCKNKCFYCGFYSVASTRLVDEWLKALLCEIELKADLKKTQSRKKTTTYNNQQDSIEHIEISDINEKYVRSLYFGGGTPSFLPIDKLKSIIDKLKSVFTFKENMEQTIECNPDDLNKENIQAWLDMGFNRLSVGVQTFNEKMLGLINRKHTPDQAMEGIRSAYESGFSNISLDLMIGIPGYNMEVLRNDIMTAASLKISHLSIYLLSIEEGTVFEKLERDGKLQIENDDQLALYYDKAIELIKEQGFEHYEISNFARNQCYSEHNTAYWNQENYLGFGPAAHSFDGEKRYWNISNIRKYIDILSEKITNDCKVSDTDKHSEYSHTYQNINENTQERDSYILDRLCECEYLSETDKYNEYIMTGLRTKWGISIEKLENDFKYYLEKNRKIFDKFIKSGDLIEENKRLHLSEKACLISDMIFSELFLLQ